MNTEIASFFDNPDLVGKSPPFWQTLNQDIYDSDNIFFEQQCQRISKKKKQLTPIAIQVGNEHLYYVKKETIYYKVIYQTQFKLLIYLQKIVKQKNSRFYQIQDIILTTIYCCYDDLDQA